MVAAQILSIGRSLTDGHFDNMAFLMFGTNSVGDMMKAESKGGILTANEVMMLESAQIYCSECEDSKWPALIKTAWCGPKALCHTCKTEIYAHHESVEDTQIGVALEVDELAGLSMASSLDVVDLVDDERFKGMESQQPSGKVAVRRVLEKGPPRANDMGSPRAPSPRTPRTPRTPKSPNTAKKVMVLGSSSGEALKMPGFTAPPKMPTAATSAPALPVFDAAAESLAQHEEQVITEALAKLTAMPQHVGVPQKGKAGILLRQRVGPFPPKAATAALGTSMQKMFWTPCFFEVDCQRLLCWKNPAGKESGKEPDQVYNFRDVDGVCFSQRELALHFKAGGLVAGSSHAKSDKDKILHNDKEPQLSPRGSKAKDQAQMWLRLCADTPEEAELWAASIKANAAATLGSVLPQGWDVSRMLDTDHAEAVGGWPSIRRSSSVSKPKRGSMAKLVAKESLPEGTSFIVQRLFDHCFIPKCTKDRVTTQMPLRLEVAEVVRVQNGAAWVEFDKARERLTGRAVEGNPLYPGVLTSTLDDPLVKTVLGELNVDANEQWLFHGSSAQGVEGISDQEFRLDLAGTHRGTLYGKGVYLAECSSKADEYAEADDEGMCTMLLCRAALGRTLVNAERRPDVEPLVEQCRGAYDSLCGDRWAAVGTYREFVLYESAQVYPAFIIRYKRIFQAGLCKEIAEAAEQGNYAAALHVIPHAARLASTHPDGTVRYQLALVLGTHSGTAVPALITGLKDERAAVRRSAAAALRQLSEYTASVACTKEGTLTRVHRDGVPAVASAVPALIHCLYDNDEAVCQAAAHTLEHVGEHAADAAPLIADRMIDKSLMEETRISMARALQFLGEHESKTLPVLMAQLAKPNEPRALQVQVARSIAEASNISPGFVEVYATYLKAEDTALRREVAANLHQVIRTSVQRGAAGMPVTVVPGLIECLSDDSPLVRASALSSLGQLRAAKAVDDIIRCLRDSDRDVRKTAVFALGRMKQQASSAVHTLMHTLSDSDPETRVATADTLAKIGPATATVVPALLRKHLADTKPEVRAAVAECLLEMCRLHMSGEHGALLHSTLDLIAQAMTDRLKDSSEPVQKLAAVCLQVIRNEPETVAKDDPFSHVVEWRRTEDQMMKLSRHGMGF